MNFYNRNNGNNTQGESEETLQNDNSQSNNKTGISFKGIVEKLIYAILLIGILVAIALAIYFTFNIVKIVIHNMGLFMIFLIIAIIITVSKLDN